MMRSTYGDEGDDEQFAKNPFRRDPPGNDLLGAPHPQQGQPVPSQPQMHYTPQQQHFQPPLQSHPLQPPHQQPHYGAQQPSMMTQPQSHLQPQQQQPFYPQSMPQQQQSQQMYQPHSVQPDPSKDMYGQQQQSQQQFQSGPYMTGQMDQARAGNDIPTPPPSGFCGRLVNCFRMDGYQPYFDLDTEDVQMRLMASVTQFWLPDRFRTGIVGDVKMGQLKGPDLYGPFWIAMTLTFLLAVTGNLSAYMHHAREAKKHQDQNEVQVFEYDINLLLRSSTVLSIFVSGVPTALWVTCNCLTMPSVPWAMWLCVYGYSMTPYLGAVLLAWIPHALWQWFWLGMATAASCLLVVRNLSTPLLSQDTSHAGEAKASPIIMSILGTHLIFLLVLKLAFFS